MADDRRRDSTEEIFAAPIANVEALRGALQQSLASGEANAIMVGNCAIIAKKKRAILYKNGHTLPTSAQVLLAEAESNIQHSRKLARNLQRGNPGQVRPQGTDAHHIVACEAAAAHPSRVLIFSVGIGINDADNGVLLPRSASNNVSSMDSASAHQNIHTNTYHANVVAELYGVDNLGDAKEIRGILRSISGFLVRGTFIF